MRVASTGASFSRVSLALVAMLMGCGAPPRERDVVVYASGADLESANPIVTVHPLARQVQRYALFVTLTRLDSVLAPAPYFARRWEWENEGRTLSMHLAGDLRWHDGTPTSARDVAFTFFRARDPASGSPQAAELRDLDAVRVVDDTTIVLEFRRPQSTLPIVLSELPLVPKHLLDSVAPSAMRQNAFATAPVGNGPFRFARRDAGQRWTFERNDDFPLSMGGPPRMRKLVVAVVDEPTTKFAGLVSGDLDVAGISPTMAALVERDAALRVASYPVLFVNAIVLNSAKPPFDDLRVRRALSAVIDRKRIIDAALAGYGIPASGPVSPDNPLTLSLPLPTPTSGDSLLDAAGWKRASSGMRAQNGRPLAFTLMTVGSGDNAIEQLVQADLREHGIEMRIRQMELGAFLAAARATPKSFDALITLVPGDLSLSWLASMFDGRLAGGALDYAGFHMPRLDSLFAQTSDAADDGERREAWHAIQRELHAQAPVTWLYHARGVQGVARRLQNVTMDLRGELVTLSQWDVRDQ